MPLNPIATLIACCIAYAMPGTFPADTDVEDARPWFVDGHKITPGPREPEVRIGGVMQPVQQRVPELLRSIEDM